MSKAKARTPSLRTRAEEESYGEVHLWLMQHRREVADLCGSVSSPWASIARQMQRKGVLNEAGGAPSPDTVRQTWKRVAARYEKKMAPSAAARVSKPPRSSRPNVEPPSRPGDNRAAHSRDAINADAQINWRERYTRQETTAPRDPAPTPQPSVNAGRPGEDQPYIPQTPAEQFAEIERQLRKADGFQPKSRNRGRII